MLSKRRSLETLFLSFKFRSSGSIDLRGAEVGTLYDEQECWPRPGKLLIEGLSYKNLQPLAPDVRLSWLQRWRSSEPQAEQTGPHEASWQPYEELASCFKRHGREGDARAIAIYKQRAITEHKPNPFSRLVHRLYGFTIRHGYAPHRAVVFAPAFIVLAVLIFETGARELMVPTTDAARKEWTDKGGLPVGYPAFNSIAYSLDSFVPVLSLQQRDTWRPNDQLTCDTVPKRCGHWLRVFLWFHIGFGWIVTTLAVAGFAGLIRRD